MAAAAKVQTVAFFQASNEIIQKIPADSACNICFCEPTETVNGRVQNIFVHIFQASTREEYHWNHEYCLDQWITAEMGRKREPACPLCRALISSEVLLPNIDTIVKLAKAILKFDEVMRDPELTFAAMTSVILAISFGGVFHLKAVESQIKSMKALRSPALYSAIIRQSMTEGGKFGGSLISAVVCAVLGRELAKVDTKKTKPSKCERTYRICSNSPCCDTNWSLCRRFSHSRCSGISFFP